MSKSQSVQGTRILHREKDAPTLCFQRSQLTVLNGASAGKAFAIEGTTITVGKASTSHLVLADDTVSAQHFELRLLESGYLLVDVGSTNGTTVNGLQVREAYLGHRSEIAAGETRLVFESLEGEVEVPLSRRTNFGDLLGHSPSMRAAFAMLERVGPTDTTLLITGESGTGKELAARAAHLSSPRKDAPYVTFDCGATTPTLIESQLFGHVRGAFTGATETRTGVFEEANGGTLVFDELGELPIELQPKLLRALENRTITRVGDNTPRPIDVRVIGCTNRNLRHDITEGRFREDLYFRFAVIHVNLPPLRERPEEIPRLVRKLLSNRASGGTPSMPETTLAFLQLHSWPGNVRELRNAVERFAIMPDLDPSIWFQPDGASSDASAASQPTIDLDTGFHEAKREFVERFERRYLSQLVEDRGANASEAARSVGLSRQSYYRLLSKYGLDRD